MPADKTLTLIQKAIDRDMSGQDIEQITRAVANGVSKGTDAEEVVNYTEKVLDGDIKGEDVAVSVYKWLRKKVGEGAKN